MVLAIRRITILVAAIVLFAAFTGLSKPAAAQVATTDAEMDDSWKKKSVTKLRREFQAAERDFYAAFNAVNEDEEYDVECRNEATLGSRRKVHACKANFLWRFEAEVALGRAELLNDQGSQPPAPDDAEVNAKQDALRQKISAAINESAEVQQSFALLAQAKRGLDAKMQSRR